MIGLSSQIVTPFTDYNIEKSQILILKMGSTFGDIATQQGDFEHWIAAGCHQKNLLSCQVLNVPTGVLPTHFDWAGIIITGSHAMVSDNLSWHRPIMLWLESALSKSIPVLGICFGHQLLAQLAGGRVGNHPQGLEIGTCAIRTTTTAKTDPLFSKLPNRFLANTVHYQSVLKLPETAQIMAFNDHDPHHAYRIDNNVWGVQFHPEFNRSIMRGYIHAVAATGQSVGEASTASTPDAQSLLGHFSNLCISGSD